jgi:hypothetical protein
MALITDPDLLNQGIEVDIDTSAGTVELIEAGNLSDAGVILKAIYSFLKEEWREDPDLIKYDFPMAPITDEQMQIGVSSRNNGWNWEGATTRGLIRTGGWQEVNSSGVVTAEYAGIVTLGSLNAGTQVYFQQVSGGSTTNFLLEGPVNQAIQVYSSTGPVDRRSYLQLFAREQGDTYATSSLADIGVATMTYQTYRFPLSTGDDNKVVTADVDIDANSDGTADVAPYSGMSLTFYDTPQSRTIGASSYNFGIIIDGNNGTAEQIYEFVQWSLRQAVDVDASAGTLAGRIAPPLLSFVGDSLSTLFANNYRGGGSGVFIDNFQTADINRISFRDNTNTLRTFPFTASLTLNFSSTLQADADAVYRVYFSNDDAGANAGNDFGTAGAIIPRTNISYSTTNRSRSSNVATITIGTHAIEVGNVIEVAGLGGTGYNGVHVVTAVAGTTVSYANTGSNEGSTGDTGGTVYRCMGGLVDGEAFIQHGYDFDTNLQRGSGSDGEDAPLTGVAIGLSNAQYVLATTTLGRSTTNSLTLTAPVERNYANP